MSFVEYLPKWKEGFLQKGRQEGRQEGEVAAFKQSIKTVLESRFGQSGLDLWKDLFEKADLPSWENILKDVIKTQSIEDLKNLYNIQIISMSKKPKT